MDTIHQVINYAFYFDKYYSDFNGDYIEGRDRVTDPGQNRYAMAGTFDNSILYFSCNMFELKSSYIAANDNGIKQVLNYFFAKLANPTGLKGVIIDVRGNPGGDVRDLNFLLGSMISSPLTFGYTRYKSGNGRLDYTPWAPAIITPQAGAKGLNIPVVALADAWSVSLAELTTMAIHTMPNGKFIGETTWGANGPISSNQNFNGGQFTVADFLSVYTSSSEFKYLNGNIYEGKGFPPDIYVPYDEATLMQGHDPAFEAAIRDILQ
jgi:carboxyl-terminal processing protease